MIHRNGTESPYHDEITLYISDCHCEYSLPEYKHGKRANNDMSEWYRTELVWDRSAIEELFGEDNMHQMLKMLPKELTEEYDEWSNIWSIVGSYEGIRLMLVEYCRVVFPGPKGGDDDTFDYWPSAFSNCKQIADDLDKIKPEGNISVGMIQPLYDMMMRNNLYEPDGPWGRDPWDRDIKWPNQDTWSGGDQYEASYDAAEDEAKAFLDGFDKPVKKARAKK